MINSIFSYIYFFNRNFDCLGYFISMYWEFTKEEAIELYFQCVFWA